MRKIIVLLFIFILIVSNFALFFPVKAEDKKIVVPDDYPTISSAIGNATDGDTIFVKKGTYEGPINQTLVINKSVSLIGENAENTIINLHPEYNVSYILTQFFLSYSDAIIVEANNCILSGFTISTKGSIRLFGDRNQIIGNRINTGLSVTGSNCNIASNIINGTISLEGSFNVINQNFISGIALQHAYSNYVSNNTFAYLHFGSVSDTSYTCSFNVVSHNVIEGEYYWGIWLGAGSNNIFYGNNISNYRGNRGWGVVLGFGSNGTNNSLVGMNNTFYHNNFINNNKNVYESWNNLTARNFWDNGKEGNYWDDYNGTDNSRDGVGETPYVINEENIDNYPLMRPWSENQPPRGIAYFQPILIMITIVVLVVMGTILAMYFRNRRKISI